MHVYCTIYTCIYMQMQELDKAVNDMKSREDELKAIKKENRKRRKVIEAYQDMINAGATGLHTVCRYTYIPRYLHYPFECLCIVSCVQTRVCQ